MAHAARAALFQPLHLSGGFDRPCKSPAIASCSFITRSPTTRARRWTRLQAASHLPTGYGDVDPALVEDVPRSAFRGVDHLQVGMRLQTQSARGPQVVIVTGVSDETVRIDGNHPLAGQHLNFAVEIANVRGASEEELAHGHVHGAGGHHH